MERKDVASKNRNHIRSQFFQNLQICRDGTISQCREPECRTGVCINSMFLYSRWHDPPFCKSGLKRRVGKHFLGNPECNCGAREQTHIKLQATCFRRFQLVRGRRLKGVVAKSRKRVCALSKTCSTVCNSSLTRMLTTVTCRVCHVLMHSSGMKAK